MEPGVPFALLGAVQLLLVAACVALAGAAVLRRTVSSAVVAVGAVVLAAVEVRTALELGQLSSDGLALGRAAALLLLATGLAAGGLPARAYGIVVPLGAATSAALFSAGAAAAAAVAAFLGLRGRTGALLAAGFAALAAGSALTAGDLTPARAALVLSLRGAGALLLLAGLVVLAQASLLSKVVAAILAGVLTMAVAAVGVVGNVVVSSYDRQTREIVEQAADGRDLALDALGRQVAGDAVLFDTVCVQGARACAATVPVVRSNDRDDFVVAVPRTGNPESYGGRAPLTPAELLGLRRLPAVQAVLTGQGADRVDSLFSIVRLAGSPPGLAVVGVGASDTRPRVSGPQSPPERVMVYGRRLDTDYARSDVDTGGFGLTLLTGDPLQVVGTNRSANAATQIKDLVARNGAATGLADGGLTIGSQGVAPTARVLALDDYRGDQVGLLVVSRDPGPALKTERDALRLLFATAVLALLLVAAAALVLGRRTVEPVRRLTLAAERVAAGDLTASTEVRGRDEVGTLARTFDGMTTSLATLTGDLRATSVRLATVLASMSDGLLATDGDRVVTSANRAALDLLGLEEPDVLGERLQVVADLRTEDGAPLVLTPSPRDDAALVHRPDRTTVPVRVAVSSLQDTSGLVVVLRDTTREREVERMKTEFLSNVSHELRTPLTPIRGYADILVAKTGLAPEMVTKFATVIRDEALKMNRVVDLLVDVAALEAGRVSASPRPVPVRELLDARLAAWGTRSPTRQKDLKRRVASGLPQVLVDPTWLGKALDEFVDNAVKYTPVGTPITLTAAWSPDGTRVRVAVKDAGPGIAEQDQEALFTSFEQVDGSATRHVGGLGLGLSFVRRLAEDAGYPLSVTSRPGKGAEFALDLPVADEPAPGAPQALTTRPAWPAGPRRDRGPGRGP